MLELLLPLAIACGDPTRDEDLGETSAPLDVAAAAHDVGIDDAVFQRADSHSYPVLACPPEAPFICRTEGAFGWTCSKLACPPPEDTLR